MGPMRKTGAREAGCVDRGPYTKCGGGGGPCQHNQPRGHFTCIRTADANLPYGYFFGPITLLSY